MSTVSQFWSSSMLSGGELAACGDPLVWETRLDALCPKVSIKARPIEPIGDKLIASYLPTKQPNLNPRHSGLPGGADPTPAQMTGPRALHLILLPPADVSLAGRRFLVVLVLVRLHTASSLAPNTLLNQSC